VEGHRGVGVDGVGWFLVTMFIAPAGWWWIVIGFLLFRLFDIVKPWPIRWLDRNVAGGFGVMIDDVLAGLMALLCLQLIARVSI